MPIPGGSEVLEVQFWWKQDNQYMINGFHWAGPVGLIPQTLAAARAIANAAFAALNANAVFKAAYSTEVALERVSAQLIWPTRFAKGYSNNAASAPGTRAGDAMPTCSQLSVETMSDAGGPGGHGGNRWPGAVTTDMTASLWNDAYILDAQAAFDPMYAAPAWIPAGFDPIIFKRSNPLGSNVIKATLWHNECRTLRRRVVGRGI